MSYNISDAHYDRGRNLMLQSIHLTKKMDKSQRRLTVDTVFKMVLKTRVCQVKRGEVTLHTAWASGNL